MRKRRLSRELSLQFLYQLDTSGEFKLLKSGDFNEALEVFWTTQEQKYSEDIKIFMEELSRGVVENSIGIDQIISSYSQNWKISRMASIDRNMLRIAVYEIAYLRNIPPPVTINEAIDIGKKYGNEETGAFVNGILDKVRLAREKGEI